MTVENILNDKSLKAKDKTENISRGILDRKINLNDLLKTAEISKDPNKATCIEALEFATKIDPGIATKDCFRFVSKTLTAKAPRVKWESAKVIGNTAHLYIKGLDEALSNLLANTEHEGTVVRWSAAFALGEIIKLKTKYNKELIPAIEQICANEEKNSIKKIYLKALSQVKK